MPRPGPRPYECVRRAWHSDRHKPLRGSIIQQIFRLVEEAHSEKTKNNREWQEKLPVVVLKCEEILYSKANSEAEYLDQETLWDRVSDAVNTIIRLEEVNEAAGKLLPPCVEAALTLGCVPVKASRSQRHCNTRTYLTPRPHDPIGEPQRAADNPATRGCPSSTPASSNFVTQDRNLDRNKGMANEPNPFTLPHKRFHSGAAPQSAPVESSNSLYFGSAYPLYYGTDYQLEDRQVGIRHKKRNRDDSQQILIGRPVTRLIPKPASMVASKSLLLKETPKTTVQSATQPCDLSLRLGMSPSLDVGKEKNFAHEADDFALDLCLSRWNSEDMGPIAESSVRNSPASFHTFMEDGRLCWQPDLPSNQLSGRKKGPGL
uniref:Histone acetyltransferase n=1 Tax=Kalanchoe fedtschenkoi TaxID=63787 RepID=A0A7N0TC13_KALFE